MPPSELPGCASLGSATSKGLVASPVPTHTTSAAAVAPNSTVIVPQALRCAGRVMPATLVDAKPASEAQFAPPSPEYQTPPLADAA
jgi:hypothetical protein